MDAELTPTRERVGVGPGTSPPPDASDGARTTGARKAAGGERRVRYRPNRLAGLSVPILLLALTAMFSIISPSTFFTSANFRVMIAGQATALLLALAATIPLRAGDFDVSVSAIMVFSACTVGVLTNNGVPAVLACLLALGAGLLVGLVNSVFIVLFEIDGFVVTLGMLTILSGLARLISKNNILTTVPQGLQTFVGHRILGLPAAVWVGWVAAALTWYIFELTPTGRFLSFVGGNRQAAHLAGLAVRRLRSSAFIAAGMISAVAGLVLVGTLGSIDPSSGTSYLLAPFTAAFLGVSAIQLGRFNVLGTVIGLYLLAVGISGLELLGVQSWIADVFNGGCLIAAVAFSRILRWYGGSPGRST